MLVDLRRPSLGERMRTEQLDPPAQRAHVASLASEAEALLSALRAKDVETRRPVIYGRAWSGFAVTLATNDLPAVQALGLRSEPVRRFYGATSTASGEGEAAATRVQQPIRTRSSSGPLIALLDSGIDARVADDRVLPVYDAVDRDRKPAPEGRGERHGTAMAGVLAAELPKGQRFASIRVAGRQRDAKGAPELEVGTSDQLLAGLERAVDPDGNGDVADRFPIALVGVSSPYSGFANTPEAEAASAAAAVGTLVIAPAGNEGAARGAYGTVGSPAASPDALAVGALDGSDPGAPRVELGLATEDGHAKLEGGLLAGAGHALRAGVTPLAGRSQAAPRGGGRAAGADPLDYLAVDARPKAKGKVVVVPARVDGRRRSLAERAVAAAAAGAAALVVCDPGSDEVPPPLPAGASGALPVIALAGDDAERALDLTGEPGGLAFVSKPRGRGASGEPRTAESSSHGPTYALAPKPDLVAHGTATTAAPGGGTTFASGSSIAAARVAALAARVHDAAPRLNAPELAAALVGTARPAGPILAAGAGRPSLAAASRAPAIAEPRLLGFEPPAGGAGGAARTATVTLSNPGRRAADLRLTAALDRGLRAAPSPNRVRLKPGGAARITVRLSGGARGGGFATGRLTARAGGRALAVPLVVPLTAPPAPKLGAPKNVMRQGEVRGVRFSLGSVTRAAGGIAVEPVGALRLAIVDARGKEVRELTPPGGAPDLLPGDYSYTLPDETSDELDPGDYRFRAIASGPTGGEARAESPPFTIR